MGQKAIEFKGIVRNLPDNLVTDGCMQEVINLRPKDGAWRPVGPKKSAKVLDIADLLFIHTVDEEYKIHIGLHYSTVWNITYIVYKNGVAQSLELPIGTKAENDVLQFAQMRRSLMISNVTAKQLIILIFEPSSNTYKIYNDGFPDTPVVRPEGVPVATTYLLRREAASDKDDNLALGLEILNYWKNYYPYGPVAIRYAWELEDGTIIKPSRPIYILTSEFKSMVDSGTTYLYSLQSYIKISTITSTDELAEIRENYTGIIKALNFYMTRLETPIVGTAADVNGVYLPKFPELNLQDQPLFYLVHSIGIDKLDAAESWSDATDVKIPAPFTDIETRSTLGTDNFTHHAIFGSSLFTYNERIFLGDIQTTLYRGTSPTEVIQSNLAGGSSTYDIYFQVDIHTSSGVKTVEISFRTFPLSTIAGVVTFNFRRYFAYPDARARTLRIYLRNGAGNYFLVSTLPLTPNELMNFSFYNEQTVVSGETVYGVYEFSDDLTDYAVAGLGPTDNKYSDSNRIQLTELSNPFVYPAINSYRVGNGRILGMSTNAIALSQGQFGHFPVFCFATDGIWTMTIGSGDPLISTIVPVSREVCNNPKSITPIDGGTVFTTAKGLHILSGPVPGEISEPAEGPYLSNLNGNADYAAIGTDPAEYDISDFLCDSSFIDYIAGAIIAWDHKNKELIVCNPVKNYSWVFSFISKFWFKISEVFARFVRDYPITYGYRTVIVEAASVPTIFDLSEEDFTSLVPVHLVTRPMKLDLRGYKKIHRALISGVINTDAGVAFYVNLFGSPDLVNWHLMNSSTSFSAQNKLLIGRSAFSCQEFILVIGGMVNVNTFLTHIEVDYEERYMDKLR